MPSEARNRLVNTPEHRGVLTSRLSRAYVTHALAGTLPRRRAHALKRAFDISLATPLYVIAAPLRLAAASSVWLRSHRRATVSVDCGGRGGAPFTLRQLALAQTPSSPLPPTPVAWITDGRVAKTPALLHVVTGRMSLVGPTPRTLQSLTNGASLDLARLYAAPGLLTLRPFGALRALAATQDEADLRYVTAGSLRMDIEQVWAALVLPGLRFERSGALDQAQRDE